MTDEILARLKKRVKNLPMQPGVYIMKDKSGKMCIRDRAYTSLRRMTGTR